MNNPIEKEQGYTAKEQELIRQLVQVPEKLFDSHKHEFAVHSKSFVYTLLSANKLDTAKNYPIHGICSQLENAIVFKLKTDAEDFTVDTL